MFLRLGGIVFVVVFNFEIEIEFCFGISLSSRIGLANQTSRLITVVGCEQATTGLE